MHAVGKEAPQKNLGKKGGFLSKVRVTELYLLKEGSVA